MKRFLFAFLFAALFASCEENFSPKTEFKEQYVLSCVFGVSATGETFTVEAYLTKSYDVDGIDPSSNTADPSVAGAKISLSYSNGDTYLLREDTAAVFDSLGSLIWAQYNRYGNPFVRYVNYAVPKKLYTISIKAELPDGTVLSAGSNFPGWINISYSYDYPHGVTPDINQSVYGDYWGIYWQAANNELYFSKLALNYSIKKDSVISGRQIEIPLDFTVKNGEEVPVYPSFKRAGSYEYKFRAFGKILSRIGEGVEDKSKIKIYGLSHSIVQFNSPLAFYFSSINGYLDEYSIRLDESVYSNISGGIGIFGIYRTVNYNYDLDGGYIKSFGYKTVNDPD